MIESVFNRGAHSVTIISIATDDVVSDIRWSVWRTVPGGYVTGIDMPWHKFPAVVPAHGIIRLLVTIHHPRNCAAYPKVGGVSTAVYAGYHRVRWESLLHSHTTDISYFQPDDVVRVC